MSVHSKIILALAVVLLLAGCIKVIELPSNIFEKRVVISGTLNPDSTIQAKIYISEIGLQIFIVFNHLITSDFQKSNVPNPKPL